MTSAARLVRRAFEPRAALGYTAGPRLEDALGLARELGDAGIGVTINYRDGRDAPAAAAPDAAHATMEALAAEPAVDAVLALKAPPFTTEGGRRALAGLAAQARAARRRMIVDATLPDATEAALEVATALRARHRDVAVALVGRWSRSPGDAEEAVALGLGVRLVKGEEPDPGDPDRDPARGVVELAERLAGRAPLVTLGSHDEALVARVLPLLQAAGTPCELELLLGLPPEGAAAVARQFGVPIRIYLPWGARTLPYDASAARRDRGLALRLVLDAAAGPRRRARTLALAGR